MVLVIRTHAELGEIVRAGHGYLYNDFGGRDPRNCPVHEVGACDQVERMLQVRPGPLSVKKLWCDDLRELLAELQRRG